MFTDYFVCQTKPRLLVNICYFIILLLIPHFAHGSLQNNIYFSIDIDSFKQYYFFPCFFSLGLCTFP
jgi:hypothetical protein